MLMQRVVSNGEIGAAIRKRRQELSLSQEQLAARLQISTQQVQRYESGKDRLNVEKLQALSFALAVPVSYFLGYDKCALVPENEHEGELLASYRKISDRESRMLVMSLARALASVGE